MSDKAVITCALNGVLTDPKQHNVPVTPEQMAREAKAAFNAGASVMHVHLRQQEPNKGHLPSWDVNVSKEIQQAIREACRASSSTTPRAPQARTIRARSTACARPSRRSPPATPAR